MQLHPRRQSERRQSEAGAPAPPQAGARPQGRSAPGAHALWMLRREAGEGGARRHGLRVSTPGDADEREANRAAERVMRAEPVPDAAPAGTAGGEPRLRRKCAHCGGAEGAQGSCGHCEEEERLRRREADGGGSVAAPDTSGVRAALDAPGRELDPGTRAFFEMRFGRDLGGVRVHTDAAAAESARSVGALAYTVGRHVVFGAGRYEPGSERGRRLLAHELAHTFQGGGALRRTPDAATLRTFDERAAAIRGHAAYRRLGSSDRLVAEEILRLARPRDNCLYYADRLLLLFNTPDAPATATASAMRQETADAMAEEQARLATPAGQRSLGVEEAATADPSRTWTRRRGEDGHVFYVDRSDPNNVVVRVRVRLVNTRPGVGAAQRAASRQDVANIRALEDSIEKHASTAGYTVDLEFVDRPGADVFPVGVDTTQWTTSGNWVGDAAGLAHELHHLLGLDDRYDYIEAHAANANMDVPDRLYWFREQVRRPPDPQGGSSIMGGGEHPLDDDVCRVAGLDLATCTAARGERARQVAAAHEARGTAFVRAFRVFELLAGIRPGSPMDVPGEPTRDDLLRRSAASLARAVFDPEVGTDRVAEVVGRMRFSLTSSLRVEVAAAAEAGCAARTAFVAARSPATVRVCPAFFAASPEQRVHALLRAAAQLAGIGGSTGGADCPAHDCGTPCDSASADAWAEYVRCMAARMR